MLIGIPREIKNNEYRVAMTPAGVGELTARGHTVLIERDAGIGSGITDSDFSQAGARILPSADQVWETAELIVKVKEPIDTEFPHLRPQHVVFTYLHLAASRACTEALIGAGCTALAYETVQLADGTLPLLAPMSQVAGRLAVQVGAYHLMRFAGGSGVLLGGVPGTARSKVVIIGGGVAGEQAATIALGMRADVTILDVSVRRLAELDARFDSRVATIRSSKHEIAARVAEADLVIGSVLVPGAAAPKLVTDTMVASMKPGSVLVDIAIDQGGCFEGSRPTTHENPTFPVHGSLFYCVANMPGAVPHTSTHALTNATMPYVTAIADHGWRDAARLDPALARGVNVHDHQIVNDRVAAAHGLEAAALTI